jgi:WD40 repeat protein
MFHASLASLVLLAAPAPPVGPGFGKETILSQGQPEPFTEVVVTADGNYYFVFDRNRRLRILNTATGGWKSLGMIGPKWLALSRDGSHIFSGGPLLRNFYEDNTSFLGFPESSAVGEQLALWKTNVHTKNHLPDTVAFPQGNRYPFTSAAFSADGKTLVTAAGKNRQPGEVLGWDVPSGMERSPRIDYKASVFYGPERDRPRPGLPATPREPPGVELLALSPNGSCLATVYDAPTPGDVDGGGVRLWDMRSGKEKGNVAIPRRRIHALAFTPDGKLLALGGGEEWEGTIWLWDVAAGRQVGVLRGHPHQVQALAVSPDGKYLASGCTKGVVKLWNLPLGHELRSRPVNDVPDPVRSMTFTSDGKALVMVGGYRQGWLRLWEVK